jgi:hypothetical protein
VIKSLFIAADKMTCAWYGAMAAESVNSAPAARMVPARTKKGIHSNDKNIFQDGFGLLGVHGGIFSVRTAGGEGWQRK